ncbi:uncharacterized protein LOC133892152 [Phragmites australis]|uniref:uncharacterized protein LOC133892152 n=1 Tax=Phragmites australis TaxID=29695 RepID=UPI002D7984B3|nr:uncharacterized protein LOC133892152 [Phragmites australis]
MDIEVIKLLLRCSKGSIQYNNGVKGFVEFAFKDKSADAKIHWPCETCVNTTLLSRDEIYEHLVCNGILENYDEWDFHGEPSVQHTADQQPESQNDSGRHANMHQLINDTFGHFYDDIPMTDGSDCANPPVHGANSEAQEFYNLVKDSEKPLWQGCELSELSLLMLLFNIKSMNKWSDKSFGDLLDILHMAIPNGKQLPKNFYEAKKVISKFGLGYENIHACPNNCQLFWKDKASDDFCSTYKASRWKDKEPETKLTNKERRKAIPRKVLRYFPIKERLKRLFMCKETAPLLRWHDKERIKDDALRHPADSKLWKSFDERFPPFASDSRNIRFGLATDGFNPYGMLSSKHSCWPVVLTIYNLPPWLCMKEHYLLLSLIVPGPKSPGDRIHVFLEPLLDDLRDLFLNGISTYDASKNETFNLKAVVLMTINDLPALGMLASYMVHGEYACPPCGQNAWTKRLKHGQKSCFMGHRRFLPLDHEFRFDRDSFDGTTELGMEPITYYERPVLDEINALGDFKESKTYKAVSSLFTLPYWDYNLLRHNLDVMHIEKNVCENIYGTLLGLDGKSKDNLKARQDLKEMNIREDLHPQQKASRKYYLPPARFALSKSEKQTFCKVLRDIRVPDGYSGNISRCVNVEEGKIQGPKTHDCHVLMQQLMTIALRGLLPDDIIAVLFDLSAYFQGICAKLWFT